MNLPQRLRERLAREALALAKEHREKNARINGDKAAIQNYNSCLFGFYSGNEALFAALLEGDTSEPLPEIYASCAHPQSVWFECHWRPRFEQMSAQLAALRADLAESTSNAIADIAKIGGELQDVRVENARLREVEYRYLKRMDELNSVTLLKTERDNLRKALEYAKKVIAQSNYVVTMGVENVALAEIERLENAGGGDVLGINVQPGGTDDMMPPPEKKQSNPLFAIFFELFKERDTAEGLLHEAVAWLEGEGLPSDKFSIIDRARRLLERGGRKE